MSRPLVPRSMRPHFTRQGDAKRPLTRERAEQLEQLFPHRVVAYQCPTCQAWHLASYKAHKPKRRKP